MKVLLKNPPYEISRYMGKLSKIAFVFQPIGLTYIASYLRSKDIEVKIFDSQIETEPIQSVVNDFAPDIIGISCVTFLVHSTIELAKLQRYANSTFFLRPRVIMVYLRRMRSLSGIKDIISGAIIFIVASVFPSR